MMSSSEVSTLLFDPSLSSSLNQDIQRELNLVMSNVDGLYAIAIIDRDGVPLMKCKMRKLATPITINYHS